MTGHQRQWTAVLATLATTGFALVLLAKLRAPFDLIDTGDAAPAFAAQRLDGRPASLADYRGRVILLNVWATWCVPCRAEMPSLERLQRKFAGTDFRVVAVSVDQEGVGVVDRFATELGLSFDILHDRSGDIQRVYQTSGVPESWVIDRDGVIVKKKIGWDEWDSPANETLVRTLLDAR
jgi:peroxiredoxin